MFVISRYVLPLLERRDRGASGEEQVGGLLDHMAGRGWHVIHDASLGRGNVDHILIGPPGIFTVETKSHPGPVRVARVHGETLRQAQAQRRAIERVTGLEVEPLIVFSRRLGGPAARAPQGRARRSRADAAALPRQARREALATSRSRAPASSSRRRCCEHHAHDRQAGGR